MAARQFLRQVVALRPCMTSATRLMAGKSHSHCLGKHSHWTRTMVSPVSFHTSTIHHNEHIINIQDTEDFTTRVLENSTPVLVDFHAGWCGPCKMLGPRLESMVASKDGKVILAKVDVDDNSELAMDHGVAAVPTVLAVKSGKIVDQFVGMKDESELESFINKLIGA